MSTPSNFKLRQHKQNRTRRRTLFIIASITLLLIVGGFYWLVLRNPSSSTDQNSNDTSIENDNSTLSESKIQSPNQDSSSSISEEVPVNNETLVAITNASQSGNQVNAAATISGATGQGTCVFLFSAPEAKPVTKEVTSSGVGNQTCSTSIPVVEFDLLGSWNLSVTFFRENTKASASTEVTIQ